MPIGCFPSLRRKLKRTPGKSPLRKKEEPVDNQSPLSKPDEKTSNGSPARPIEKVDTEQAQQKETPKPEEIVVPAQESSVESMPVQSLEPPDATGHHPSEPIQSQPQDEVCVPSEHNETQTAPPQQHEEPQHPGEGHEGPYAQEIVQTAVSDALQEVNGASAENHHHQQQQQEEEVHAHHEEEIHQQPKQEPLKPLQKLDPVLPAGLHWEPMSDSVPVSAVDIHELHFPINVGMVETPKGNHLCKYLDRNKSFYASVDEREEAYTHGKILCMDEGAHEQIELEWVHVSTPDIRSRNLVTGCETADGKPMYVARGMIPLTGPWPNYELSSGWVSDDLEQAHLAFMGVDWKQRDFDVLAWKPRHQ